MGRLTKASKYRKTLAKGIVEGKDAKSVYKAMRPDVTERSAEVNASRMLSHAETQAEIARLLEGITPESVITRIDEIARTAPLKETQLKALVALGNTRKASIFKDSAPTITNNTLNVFDLDDLRRRLADNTYSSPSITPELT